MELGRKLARHGADCVEVEAAIEKLAAAGWQDDARFAASLVRSRAAAGQGPIRIRAELATHGLGREAVAAALDAYEGDWSANARDLVRRRLGEIRPDDRLARHKAVDLLMRRGFGSEHIRAATRFELDE
jgi:regulatory protein